MLDFWLSPDVLDPLSTSTAVVFPPVLGPQFQEVTAVELLEPC